MLLFIYFFPKEDAAAEVNDRAHAAHRPIRARVGDVTRVLKRRSADGAVRSVHRCLPHSAEPSWLSAGSRGPQQLCQLDRVVVVVRWRRRRGWGRGSYAIRERTTPLQPLPSSPLPSPSQETHSIKQPGAESFRGGQ